MKIMKILMEQFLVVFNVHYHCQNLISIHLLNIAVVQMVLNTVALILKSIIKKTLLFKNIDKKIDESIFLKKVQQEKYQQLHLYFVL